MRSKSIAAGTEPRERIDLDRQGLLRVTGKPDLGFQIKSYTERSVPLNRELLAHLLEVRKRHPRGEWVCLNAEFRQWSLGLTRWARELFETAGVTTEHGTLHRLRHTFCTSLLVAGADIGTIRDLAGHRDISTTGRYLSTTSERRRAAVEATV